jgi:beta-galactosidase
MSTTAAAKSTLMKSPIKPRLSGEIQYFRIEKERWGQVLDQLRETGCNTVSTYIPWGWHEPVEGRFDFTGKTHPCRDLKGFLALVKKKKFDLMVRPGPYINAETTGQGHPLWLLDDPKYLVFGNNGKPLAQSECYFGVPVSYLCPAYLAKVRKWFKAVIPLFRNFPGLKSFQVDNEISYNIMHVSKEKHATYKLDYQPYITKKGGLFQQWLRRKYKKVDALNRGWRTRLASFDQAKAPVDPGKQTEGDFVRTTDWLAFKEWGMAHFLRTLCEYAYADGIRVPFVVNSPLIDDSCVYTFHKHVEDPRWEVIAGLDLYPGAVRPEEIGWMQSMVEFARSTGCERPGGIEICACEIYFRHHWIQERFDYESLFKLLTATGLIDINYYWFSDGYNFDGFGCLGSRQIYNAPITREVKKRYQFKEIVDNNKFIKSHPEIYRMKTKYNVALTYDDFYSQASRFDTPWATEWHDEMIHGEGNMGCLIDLLGVENISAQMLHITDDFSKIEAPTLIMTVYDYWRRGTAEKVIDYVEKGGDVIIFGRLPMLDEQLYPYPEFSRWLGVKPDHVYPAYNRAVRTVTPVIYQNDSYQFHSKVQVYKVLDKKATVFAAIEGGKYAAGVDVKKGKGRVRVFGCIPRLFMEASRTFITKLLKGPNPEGLYRYIRESDTHRFTTLMNMSDFDKTASVDGRRVRVERRDVEFVVTKLHRS